MPSLMEALMNHDFSWRFIGADDRGYGGGVKKI